MSLLRSVLVFASALATAIAWSVAPADAPYAGLEQNRIKALSAEQIDDLLSGRGMGLALAAEVNGYPGPRHVLDLADRLDLSPEQRSETERLFQEMQAGAVERGQQIVAGEAALDELFAAGHASATTVRQAAVELGRLEGELRALHLNYHLAMRDLLTPEQTAAYQEQRGYRSHGSGHRHRSD